MSAQEAREALYRDLVAGRTTSDALRERVAAVWRLTGIPAAAVLLDLYPRRGLLREVAPGAG